MHLIRYCQVPTHVLRLPDFDNEFVLQTDASNSGIGAFLLQEESGVQLPVTFASKKRLPTDCKYCTNNEKERLPTVL